MLGLVLDQPHSKLSIMKMFLGSGWELPLSSSSSWLEFMNSKRKHKTKIMELNNVSTTFYAQETHLPAKN
jgi:hypothetical protein